MRSHTPTSTLAALAVGGVLLLASCGGSTDSQPVATDTESTLGPVATDPVPNTDVPTTTAAPETTVAPTTAAPTATAAPAPATTAAPVITAAPATTVAPPAPAPGPTLTVADLVLLLDGVGPLSFGGPDPSTAIGVLSPLIGAPTQNSAEAYPVPDGTGYENPDTDTDFAHPFSQTVCFANGLCTFFGGATADTVVFVGYEQGGEPGGLATTSGVRVGSVWADYSAAMTVYEGGCFSIGYGEVDGLPIVVASSGDFFIEYDAAGTPTYNVPAQSEVDVVAISSGIRPLGYNDC